MNAAGIRALEQARGYYAEGVVNAGKRVREAEEALGAILDTSGKRIKAAEEALAEVTEQHAKAQTEVAELDAALAEANGVES